MSYSVQFVGLVCFFRQGQDRLALLPDGREPGHGIDPHYGSIVVDPKAVTATSGWDGAKGVSDGRFPLEPCQITLSGATDGGDLDTKDHKLPQLKQIDPKFEIDPDRAQTIAKVPIRRGTLTSYLIPGGTAPISQLVVPHDGPITITVKDDAGPVRTIELKAGTEIAIANMAAGNLYAQAPNRGPSHFQIYEKLSTVPVTLHEPDAVELPHSKSQQILFSRPGPITLYTDCANTGCC